MLKLLPSISSVVVFKCWIKELAFQGTEMEITHRLKFSKMSSLSRVMLNLLYRWANQLSKTEYACRIMKMYSSVTGTKMVEICQEHVIQRMSEMRCALFWQRSTLSTPLNRLSCTVYSNMSAQLTSHFAST